MIADLAETPPETVRVSLGVILGITGVLLVPWVHAFWRWRRYGNATTPEASLSYQGWVVAFAIAFACLHVLCFGTFGCG